MEWLSSTFVVRVSRSDDDVDMLLEATRGGRDRFTNDLCFTAHADATRSQL